MTWELKEDISREVWGKYTHGFIHRGFEYSDEDESSVQCGVPRIGAIPSPRHKDRRPWRGEFIEAMRELFGKIRVP